MAGNKSAQNGANKRGVDGRKRVFGTDKEDLDADQREI